ncbi:cilia- and flagella-associated protein 95 [Gastrophryne carolinensis]
MAMYVMDGSVGGHSILERKGSLHLRSNHMHYNKRTLVSGWHHNREAEPKDYDVKDAPLGKKNLCRSSYMRFGNLDIKDWNTTTQNHLSQIQTQNDYKVRDVPKKMVNEDNITVLNIKRQTGCPERGFGSALPHHSKDHRKLKMASYGPTVNLQRSAAGFPDTALQAMLNVPAVPAYSSAYKKCHSQFTDTADYRRHGRNTWHDESGVYGNRQIKQLLFKSTCPITTHL